MSKTQKIVSFQNLAKYAVLVNDTDPNSRYFNLSDVPDVLTSGKNAFLINGSPELEPTTEVKVEIIDSQGHTVFLQPIKNYQEGLARVVSIEIYEDTPPGRATMTIMGELRRTADGQPIPLEWVDKYNVKFTRQFTIQPSAINSTKVRLYKTPEISVQELLVQYLAPTTASIAMLSGSGVLRDIKTSQFPNFPSSQQNPALSPINTINAFYLSNFSYPFVSDMEGGVVYAPAYNYTGSIIRVFNSSSIQLSTGSVGGFAITPTPISLSYQPSPQFTPTSLTKSLADIKLSNLTTFAGEVARTKIYVKSIEQTGVFQLIEDRQLQSIGILTTSSASGFQNIAIGDFDPRLPAISQYWQSGLANPTSGYTVTSDVTMSYSSARIINAAFNENTPTGSQFFFGVQTPLIFSESLEYTFTGNLACFKPTSNFDAVCNVYLSGSAFPVSNPLGYLVQTFEVQNGKTYTVFDNASFNFTALGTGQAYLNFVISGSDAGSEWNFANIAINGSTERGFNLDAVEMISTLIGRRFETLIFKAELLDPNSNIIPIDIESVPIKFNGGNVYIQGTDNRITGQLKISIEGDGGPGAVIAAHPSASTIGTATTTIGPVFPIPPEAFPSYTGSGFVTIYSGSNPFDGGRTPASGALGIQILGGGPTGSLFDYNSYTGVLTIRGDISLLPGTPLSQSIANMSTGSVGAIDNFARAQILQIVSGTFPSGTYLTSQNIFSPTITGLVIGGVQGYIRDTFRVGDVLNGNGIVLTSMGYNSGSTFFPDAPAIFIGGDNNGTGSFASSSTPFFVASGSNGPLFSLGDFLSYQIPSGTVTPISIFHGGLDISNAYLFQAATSAHEVLRLPGFNQTTYTNVDPDVIGIVASVHLHDGGLQIAGFASGTFGGASERPLVFIGKHTTANKLPTNLFFDTYNRAVGAVNIAAFKSGSTIYGSQLLDFEDIILSIRNGDNTAAFFSVTDTISTNPSGSLWLSGDITASVLRSTQGVTNLRGISYTWPSTQLANSFLHTDGLGNLSWGGTPSTGSIISSSLTSSIGFLVQASGTLGDFGIDSVAIQNIGVPGQLLMMKGASFPEFYIHDGNGVDPAGRFRFTVGSDTFYVQHASVPNWADGYNVLLIKNTGLISASAFAGDGSQITGVISSSYAVTASAAQHGLPAFTASNAIGTGADSQNRGITSTGWLAYQGNIGGVSNATLGTYFLGGAGALLGWNFSNGGGEADFFALRGGGSTGGFRFYDYATGAPNLIFTMGADGTITVPTVTITGLPAAVLNMQGSAASYVLWNTNGVAAPIVGRSAGSKLVLYPGPGSITDYALGIDTNTMWFTVPSTGQKYKFYFGATPYLSLDTGSLFFSGSVTASAFSGVITSASYATTASYAALAQNVLGSITSASFAETASFAVSASWAPGGSSVSASYALTSSYAQTTDPIISSSYALTSSYSALAQNVLGSITSASFAETASYAVTASFANDIPTDIYHNLTISGSFIVSGSSSFYVIGPQFNTGSIFVTGSVSANFFYGDATNLTGAIPSASYAITSSYAALAQNVLGSITSASFAETASYASLAQNVLGSITSASFAETASFAVSASWAPGSGTSTSASYALTSSYAQTTDPIISSSYAITSSYAALAQNVLGSIESASFAETASFAVSASWAPGGSSVSASYAVSSSYAQTTDPIISSSYALTSSYAALAQNVLGSIESASYALTASAATSLTFTPATASFATTASYATTVVTASYLAGRNAPTAYNAGSIYASGSLTASLDVQANRYMTFGGNLGVGLPSTFTGTGVGLLGWNRSSGGGEIDFYCFRGAGAVGGFRFYDYGGAENLVLTISPLGAITATSFNGNLVGGTLSANTSGISGLLTLTGGSANNLFLNGATANWIRWSNAGFAAPSYTTASTGTKLLLYPNIAANTTDYAIGIEANTMWFGVPQGGVDFFRWYGATTKIAELTSSGSLWLNTSLTASVVSASTVVVTGSIGAYTGSFNQLYIPTSSGAPTYTPTAKSGYAVLTYDVTDKFLYIHDGTAWLSSSFV